MCVMYTCIHVGVCMYGAEADMGGVFLNVSPLGLLRRGLSPNLGLINKASLEEKAPGICLYPTFQN